MEDLMLKTKQSRKRVTCGGPISLVCPRVPVMRGGHPPCYPLQGQQGKEEPPTQFLSV